MLIGPGDEEESCTTRNIAQEEKCATCNFMDEGGVRLCYEGVSARRAGAGRGQRKTRRLAGLSATMLLLEFLEALYERDRRGINRNHS